MRVVFDPRTITYEDLVRKFWSDHTPSSFGSRQYRSAVFVHSPEQRAAVHAVRDEIKHGSPFASACDHTAVEEAGTFYRAEEYHQRFLVKQMMGSMI